MKPLVDIFIPEPKPEQSYHISLLNKSYTFANLKHLLGAADFSKAGERNAKLAAADEATREAARSILSDITLQHLYENPLTDNEGKVDSVMRVNYDIDTDVFVQIQDLSVGDLKNTLLASPGDKCKAIGRALTGVMAAAVAKLCDTHELIYIASKIHHVTKARTTLGLPNQLSSRLQPNHPTDDLRGLTLLTYAGFAMGGGDCLIGVNPAIDTVDNVSKVLRHLDATRRQFNVPTQICVLSHIKTQMECLKQGAPVEIAFQSLAGTESTNLSEFDISVELLDAAYQQMKESGPLSQASAEQFMYFETGQGSEFTYNKHNGIDMTTTEALCYGLARRYDPFMVNNVTGFIGPETHASNFEMVISCLQDHFMGKLLGLPMGMAPCYTLHSNITLEGQQMATQMLTAAGANYFMDVYLNTDRMLAYFDTGPHDNQTLREIYHKQPAPEYLTWALGEGIYEKDANTISGIKRGSEWGNIKRFCHSDMELNELVKTTPSVYGFKSAGPRPIEKESREVKANQAVSRAAISSELDERLIGKIAEYRLLNTLATSKEAHLNGPDLGAFLSDDSKKEIVPEDNRIQIVISDGLSAEAVHHNVPHIMPILANGLSAKGVSSGKPILVPYGRVKLAEDIAQRTNCELVILLIGERPGGTAAASTSLSAYMAYHLKDDVAQAKAAKFNGNELIRFEYSVISNIYQDGLNPIEAGSLIAELADKILQHQAAGNRLVALEAN